MKKSINSKILIVLIGFLYFTCDQDDTVGNIPRENATVAEIVENSISINESEDASFTLLQEKLITPKYDDWEAFDDVSGQIGIRVIGGTAIQGEDYDINLSTIQDFSPFLLQDGYYYSYDASVGLEHTISGIIDVADDGISEGSETIELQFFPVALGFIIIDDKITITITD